MDRFFDLSIEQKLPKEELVTIFGQVMTDDLLKRMVANSFKRKGAQVLTIGQKTII
jgi:hypothetical protein